MDEAPTAVGPALAPRQGLRKRRPYKKTSRRLNELTG